MDKRALVIGSSGGIGNAICTELCQKGWQVLGVDIVDPDAGMVANSRFTFCAWDISGERPLAEVLHGSEAESGLDAVIYAAGVYDHFPLAEAESGRLEKIIDINVLGFARVVSETLNKVSSAGGRYVVISSETAMVSLPFQVYGTSKRMLEAYTSSLQQELAMTGIPLVVIRPGAHNTGLLHHSRAALEQFNSGSKFSRQLEIVKRRGQEVIDRGAADPSAIAPVVIKALGAKRPRRIYHVNVALHFRLLQLLPDAIVRRVFKLVLRTKR